MEAAPLARLCIHTATTKPLSLVEAVRGYREIGAAGITVWREALGALGVKESAGILAGSGLRVVSLCRGGFFTGTSAAERQKALDENCRAIEEAVGIGAPVIVLVCGATPGMPLAEGRKQIVEAIGVLIPRAKEAGVKLAIEPLHPMYAADRSAVSTMKQANDMVEALGSSQVGVAIDVYHVWWDEALEAEIARCGRLGAILAFHVCDWRRETRHLLLDRGLMGEGCIPLRQIRSWVEAAGFEGMIEVEVFSSERWSGDQMRYLEQIQAAYLEYA